MNRKKDHIETELMALVAEFAQLFGYLRKETVRRICKRQQRRCVSVERASLTFECTENRAEVVLVRRRDRFNERFDGHVKLILILLVSSESLGYMKGERISMGTCFVLLFCHSLIICNIC